LPSVSLRNELSRNSFKSSNGANFPLELKPERRGAGHSLRGTILHTIKRYFDLAQRGASECLRRHSDIEVVSSELRNVVLSKFRRAIGGGEGARYAEVWDGLGREPYIAKCH